jgi:methyl-accepting chemotaxis protein
MPSNTSSGRSATSAAPSRLPSTEQGAATTEIARSVEIAAKRTVETADEVSLVGAATEGTRASASSVKAVADDLSSVAGCIRDQLDSFFARLSA